MQRAPAKAQVASHSLAFCTSPSRSAGMGKLSISRGFSGVPNFGKTNIPCAFLFKLFSKKSHCRNRLPKCSLTPHLACVMLAIAVFHRPAAQACLLGPPLPRVQTRRCRLYWRICGQWKLDSPQMRFLRSYFRCSAPGATGRRIPRDRQRQGL